MRVSWCLLALISAISLHGWLSQAIAQNEKGNPGEPSKSGVLISFKGRGDSIGTSVAAVMSRVLSQRGALPTETKAMMEGDTVCGTLERLGFPPPCEPYLPLIDALNQPGASKRPIRAGTELQFPGLHLSEVQSVRVYSKSDPSEVVKGRELLKNWVGAERVEPEDKSSTFGVKFKTYRLMLSASDDNDALTLLDQLQPLQSKNVVISPILTKPAAAKFNSYPHFPAASAVENECLSQQLAQNIADYSQLVSGDESARAQMLQGLGQPSSDRCVPGRYRSASAPRHSRRARRSGSGRCGAMDVQVAGAVCGLSPPRHSLSRPDCERRTVRLQGSRRQRALAVV